MMAGSTAMSNPLQSLRLLRALEDDEARVDEDATELDSDDGDNDDDEEKRRRRREIIRKIVTYVLSYHTLPTVEPAHDIVDKATVGTSLSSSRIKVDPALALLPHPYPTVKFNGYAYKRGPTIVAKNGIIHLIGAPLLPPLSPLNGLFLFPTGFSTLTSDLQRLDLTEGLVPHMPHESDDEHADVHMMAQELLKEHGHDAKTYTIFAPGNFAFNRLPPKILAFLHSPFPISKRILAYGLKYHIVPDIAFFSDFMKNDTKSDFAAEYISKEELDVQVPSEWLLKEDSLPTSQFFTFRRAAPCLLKEDRSVSPVPRPNFPRLPLPGRPRPGHEGDGGHDGHHDETHRANVTHYTLPTLLSTSGENKNATLHVVVVKYRFLGKGPIKRSIVVLPHHEHEHHHEHDIENGHEHGHPPPARPVKVTFPDLPARNGAVHVSRPSHIRAISL